MFFFFLCTNGSAGYLMQLSVNLILLWDIYEPKLISTEFKQRHLNNLKEVKTPWVLVGALNSGPLNDCIFAQTHKK